MSVVEMSVKVDFNDMVAKYVTIRDKRAELSEKHKQEMAPFNQAMEGIESFLLTEMDKLGADSLKTASGTLYKSIAKSVKAVDMESFKKFVFEPDCPRWDLVDFRPLKKGVTEYVESEGVLPPGLTMDSFTTLNIRRS